MLGLFRPLVLKMRATPQTNQSNKMWLSADICKLNERLIFRLNQHYLSWMIVRKILGQTLLVIDAYFIWNPYLDHPAHWACFKMLGTILNTEDSQNIHNTFTLSWFVFLLMNMLSLFRTLVLKTRATPQTN